LTPVLNDRFWVNLIGRGYPAPTSIFRWCTERLKINASNRFILNKVAEYGEVILALGSRRGESATRDQVLKMHRFRGHVLARHGQLPGAWVYMPVEHFSTDDVWTYLLQVPSPWGGDNRSLASLYRSAQDGECPLVVDDTTPSCGNSRFGCWTCTVVDRDRSMEAMIDSGEEWMIPLLEFRDWLASTQDPAVKPAQRDYRSRDGRIKITDDGRLRWRTYTLEFSKEMLRRLLETQLEVQAHDSGFVLIGEAELREIRRLWLTERQDWEDSLPKIYAEVTGRSLDWDYNDVSIPGQLELELLQQFAQMHSVPIRLVQKLLDAEWQYYGMRRRGLIHKTIEKILKEDWRSFEEVEAEMIRRREKGERRAEAA
jgi:DNA sulfur modification protein DndC